MTAWSSGEDVTRSPRIWLVRLSNVFGKEWRDREADLTVTLRHE
jgi:hypothetical protein